MPLVAVLLMAALPATDAAVPAPEELVVTAGRTARAPLDLIGNTAKLSERAVNLTNAQHVYELGVRAPATWISRGSGQEHLTAIRSPVLTGPGACGAFLIMEDTIPTRPAGFCNVNQLFEIPTELAESVEIVRGPANALYGSNGLHGTLNVLMPAPGRREGWSGSAAAGPDDYRRGKLQWDGGLGNTDLVIGGLADEYDGFRDDSGYNQQKFFARADRDLSAGLLRFGFDATNLDQETAGFIRGEDAYKDEDLRTTNPNPEAFRDADSQRAWLQWLPGAGHALEGTSLRVYLRRTDMEFLQHFLPGQPLEENGHVSAGAIADITRAIGDAVSVTGGIDAEIADIYLEEFQENDAGIPDRPQGLHYDYDVFSAMTAAYAQAEWRVDDAWTLLGGLRLEYLRYDYDNKMQSGNAAGDGTPCAPDPCLFSRPADRTDDFFNIAPNVGVNVRISDSAAAWLSIARGFRAPQTTELYRLQSGQSVAELDTETADSIELGVHWSRNRIYLEAAAFAMKKRDSIFRDADGFNVSNGKSKHYGIELLARIRFESGLYADAAATWARHEYDFDRNFPRSSDVIRSGNDVDTAPRTLGSARIGFDRGPGLAELEWVHMGRYYLDAANAHRYPGHDIFNARMAWRIAGDWFAALRVNNLTDKLYADRADYAFFDYRYFPAREREFFIEIGYKML